MKKLIATECLLLAAFLYLSTLHFDLVPVANADADTSAKTAQYNIPEYSCHWFRQGEFLIDDNDVVYWSPMGVGGMPVKGLTVMLNADGSPKNASQIGDMQFPNMAYVIDTHGGYYVDRDTRVVYRVVYTGGYNGISVAMDAQGKPVLAEPA